MFYNLRDVRNTEIKTIHRKMIIDVVINYGNLEFREELSEFIL